MNFMVKKSIKIEHTCYICYCTENQQKQMMNILIKTLFKSVAQ